MNILIRVSSVNRSICIDTPLRMTNDNNSLIDNIFTNNNYAHKYNGILLNIT